MGHVSVRSKMRVCENRVTRRKCTLRKMRKREVGDDDMLSDLYFALLSSTIKSSKIRLDAPRIGEEIVNPKEGDHCEDRRGWEKETGSVCVT
jgi:hypothetical protein